MSELALTNAMNQQVYTTNQGTKMTNNENGITISESYTEQIMSFFDRLDKITGNSESSISFVFEDDEQIVIINIVVNGAHEEIVISQPVDEMQLELMLRSLEKRLAK